MENKEINNQVINEIEGYIKKRDKDKPHYNVWHHFHSRIMIKLLRDLAKFGIKMLTDGYVIITRWDNGEKKEQKVKGINSAIRMQEKILAGYSDDTEDLSEITKLEKIEEVIQFVNSQLQNWKNLKSNEKKQTQKQIIWAFLRLENCRDFDKVSAKEKFEESFLLEDSLGRFNPGAILAQHSSALESLMKRLHSIDIKMGIVALRKTILESEKRRQKRLLHQTQGEVNLIKNTRIFKNGVIKPHELKPILQKTQNGLRNLATVWSFPYSWQAENVRDYLRQMETAVNGNNIENLYIATNNAMAYLMANLEQYG